MTSSVLRHPLLHRLAAVVAATVAVLFCASNTFGGASMPTARTAFPMLLLSMAFSLPVLALPSVMGMLAEPGSMRRWFALESGGIFNVSLWMAGRLVLVFGGCMALLSTLDPAGEQETARLLVLLSPGQRAVMGLFLCMAVPMAEECLFRGVLLETCRPMVAVPLSALLFALAHGLNAYLLPLFFMGWVLGWLALRTRTLLPGIMLHGLFNLISLLNL